MTLLADYGLRRREWIPSEAVVALLGEFGVTAGGARAALSRLARRQMLERLHRGRRTAYRLTSGAAAALAQGGAAVVGFPDLAERWDGRWTLVAFSLPEPSDAPRRALRTTLRWLGFVPLYDGLWVAPHDLPPGSAAAFADLGPGALTVFRAERLDDPRQAGRDPRDAWDLAGVRGRYDTFVERWSALLPRIAADAVGGTEALHARTEVMDTYRHFLSLDPRLPARLMPDGWPRARAREVFAAVYDGLLEVALAHVRETVDRFEGADAPVLEAHTVADLLAGLPDLPSPVPGAEEGGRVKG